MSPSEYTESMLVDLQRPIIITVRDESEGGQQPSWCSDNRIGLYKRYMSMATLVDIEASTAIELAEAVDYARQNDVGIIVSAHDFNGVPSASAIDKLIETFLAVGGDILKIAVMPKRFSELLSFFECVCRADDAYGIFIAPMAMGEFGKISRVMAGR
ncbi:MAG: type I 3-dehydroquinate dehydratase, partial [Patescibacteria group bacterium]|nr:type I 3-dehydroquinate dehydratase [Patescibacteria group bacterium]